MDDLLAHTSRSQLRPAYIASQRMPAFISYQKDHFIRNLFIQPPTIQLSNIQPITVLGGDLPSFMQKIIW